MDVLPVDDFVAVQNFDGEDDLRRVEFSSE
jgi:hypothetical protein